MKETDIQKSICDYLAYRRHLFWRNNNAPTVIRRKVGTRWVIDGFRKLPVYTMKGLPDIIVIKDGYFIGLEVKRENGRQSPDQKEFQRLCKEAGAEYYIVKSIDDVRNIGL